MHQNSPFSDIKKFCGGGTRPWIAGEARLLIWTTLNTAPTVVFRRKLLYTVTLTFFPI